MTTRTRFRCESKVEGIIGSVVLVPVGSDNPDHENRAFWNRVPSGHIEMYITNPEGYATFKRDQEVFVDFTPIV